MFKLKDFEVIGHGIENSQYFQGCGTTRRFNEVITGCGFSEKEAFDDAIEQICMTWEIDHASLEPLEKECEKADDKDVDFYLCPEDCFDSEDCYFYVSIRFNLSRN